MFFIPPLNPRGKIILPSPFCEDTVEDLWLKPCTHRATLSILLPAQTHASSSWPGCLPSNALAILHPLAVDLYGIPEATPSLLRPLSASLQIKLHTVHVLCCLRQPPTQECRRATKCQLCLPPHLHLGWKATRVLLAPEGCS